MHRHLHLLPGRDEANAFTRLAHAMRHGKDHLPTEFLLPGDVVDLEGGRLTVARVNRTRHFVTLDFREIDYVLIVRADRPIRVLDTADGDTSRASGAAALTLYDFTQEAEHRRRLATPSPWLGAA